jgi:hypothetical protein
MLFLHAFNVKAHRLVFLLSLFAFSLRLLVSLHLFLYFQPFLSLPQSTNSWKEQIAFHFSSQWQVLFVAVEGK